MTVEDQLNTVRYDYLPLETVLLGRSAAEAVTEQAQQREARRVFVSASHSLHTQTQTVNAIAQALGERCAGVFDRVPAHTPRPAVLAALAAARDAQADLLVAVGGGSVIDATKTVQFALNNGVHTEADLLAHAQFADGSRGPKAGRRGAQDHTEPEGRRIRQIAVPTTLSGAEFSNTAGVSDTARGAKEGYRDRDLCAQAIVYDPALALHTPEWLWLSTAIRSLDHAIEGYCAPEVHPYLEAQFLHAMQLFAGSLRRVKQDPADVAARALNQQAVWLACCGLGRVSHGASHGIGYILGALCGVPHGYTSCLMLPAVLRWNAAVNRERQRAIAAALGCPGREAGEVVAELVADLGLPTSLAAAGVKETQLPEIAERAAAHRVVRKNPRPIESAAEVMEILRLAW